MGQFTDKSSFIQPVKGKLTANVLERELSDIPEAVLSFFDKLTYEKPPVPHRSGTGAALVYVNDDDNVRDNDTVNDRTAVYGNPEINELFSDWYEIVGYELTSDIVKNRRAASNLLKKHGRDGIKSLLRGVDISQKDKFAPRISDFVTLQGKANELVAWGKRTGNSGHPKVGIA